MAYLPIEIPAGIYGNGTRNQTRGRWYDCNLIRWDNGVMVPVGGNVKLFPDKLEGIARGMISWRDNSGSSWLAIGTTKALYAWNGNQLTDITPPDLAARPDSGYGYGYGAATYGESTYGTRRDTSGILLEASNWTFDTWGQNLVGVLAGDGVIYEWTLSGATGIEVPNAPRGCRSVMVSAERIMLAFGADGDPRRIRWSASENNQMWTPSPLNQAGDAMLQTVGIIQSAKKMRGQIIVLTDTDAHSMTYIGMPFVYSIQKVGDSCGCVGTNAAIGLLNSVVWMGTNGFFIYDGYTRPIPCDVEERIFNNFNQDQSEKVCAGHNGAFGEVWWFYPSLGSQEPDRYVIWNYRENWWSIGELSRTAWEDAGVFTTPLSAKLDGHIYRQETGWTDDGTPRTDQVWAQTGSMQLETGDNVYFVKQMLVDSEDSPDQRIKIDVRTRFTPNGSYYDEGSFIVDGVDGYTDCMFKGREWQIKCTGLTDSRWRIAGIRLDATQGGKR